MQIHTSDVNLYTRKISTPEYGMEKIYRKFLLNPCAYRKRKSIFSPETTNHGELVYTLVNLFLSDL